MTCSGHAWALMASIFIAMWALAGSATTPLYDWTDTSSSARMSQYMLESCASGNLLIISAKGCVANVTRCDAEAPFEWMLRAGSGGAGAFLLVCFIAQLARLCGAKAGGSLISVFCALASLSAAAAAAGLAVLLVRDNCPPLQSVVQTKALGVKIGYGTYCLGVGTGLCVVALLLSCCRPADKDGDGAVTHAAYEPREIDYAELEQCNNEIRTRSETLLAKHEEKRQKQLAKRGKQEQVIMSLGGSGLDRLALEAQ